MFRIDVLAYSIAELERLFGVDYSELKNEDDAKRAMRIIADHLRSAVFLLSDGVMPGNKERGYVVRRLIRKSVFEVFHHGISATDWISKIAEAYIRIYADTYPDLKERETIICEGLTGEAAQFLSTIKSGLKILAKYLEENGKKEITAEQAFILFTTYGFPLELTCEHAKVDTEGFWREFKKHQDLSRAASAGVFKGGLADHSEETRRLHTAHHLLLKALQTVLGPQVKQRGSNITSERLRMDFLCDAKMTDEQKKEVERIVNEKIVEDLPVVRTEMPREEAEKLGAEHEFGQKYPDRVSVYSIGPKSATLANPQFEKAYSLEFCGGPHVARTGAIGKIKIIKEEAVSAGVRRIRAAIEEIGGLTK